MLWSDAGYAGIAAPYADPLFAPYIVGPVQAIEVSAGEQVYVWRLYFDDATYAADAAHVVTALENYFGSGASVEHLAVPFLADKIMRDAALKASPESAAAQAWAAWTSPQGWNAPALAGFFEPMGTPQYAMKLGAMFGMSPHDYYGEFAPWLAGQGIDFHAITNPYVGARTMLDGVIGYLGLTGNAKVMAWRDSVQAALESGGDAWAASQNSPVDILTIVKAVGWAMLPLALGVALTGTTTFSALGFEGATAGGEAVGALGLEAPQEAAWLGEVAGETSAATAEASGLSTSQVIDAVKTIQKIESTLVQQDAAVKTAAPAVFKTASGATVTAAPAYASAPAAPLPSYAAPSGAASATPTSYLTAAGRIVTASLAHADPYTGALTDSLTGEALYTAETAGTGEAPESAAAGLMPWLLLGLLGVALVGRKRK
jgi:hypothetical protein